MAVTWNYENAAHLLRRAAFGGTPSEIQSFLDRFASVEEAVDYLVSFRLKAQKLPKGGNSFYEAKRKQQTKWLKLMLKASNPQDALREKMTLFWHHHLASGQSKQPDPSYMALQNLLFRVYARGNFKDLMREYNRDPANLYYLDGIVNYASNDGVHVNANENFAREIMELFTLGITQIAADGSDDPARPNYTESDVHQLARALSGWVSIQKGRGQWRDWAWDGGQYDDDGDDLPDDVTIFGVTNNNFRIDDEVAGTADDVLELLFSRTDDDGNNQVAMFLTRKLWAWFAYPPPVPGMKLMLEPIAAVFEGSGFDVTELLRAILSHDEFYSDTAKSRTVKHPVDYVVGALRSFRIKGNAKYVGDSDLIGDMLADMGMDLFEPPNVAGFPTGLEWITTGTLLNRAQFARRLAESDYGSMRLRLGNIEGLPLGNPNAPVEDVVDALVDQLGLSSSYRPYGISTAQRDELILYAGGGGATLDLTHEYTDDAYEIVRGLISVLLQSAENQIY